MQPFSDQNLYDVPVRYDFVDSLLHILNGGMTATAEHDQIFRFTSTAALNRDDMMHDQMLSRTTSMTYTIFTHHPAKRFPFEIIRTVCALGCTVLSKNTEHMLSCCIIIVLPVFNGSSPDFSFCLGRVIVVTQELLTAFKSRTDLFAKLRVLVFKDNILSAFLPFILAGD